MKAIRYILGLVVLMLVLGSAAPPVGRYGSRSDRSSEQLRLYTAALSQLIIRGDTLRTRQLAEEALSHDTLHTPTLMLLARIAPSLQQRWAFSERALRSDTTNHYAREMAADAAARAGQTQRAIELYKPMADTTSNLELIHRLAVIQMLSNNLNESLALLDTLDTRFGYSEATSRLRQHIYNVQGSPEKAEAEALRLYNESPYDAYNTATLASYYEGVARFEEALTYYDKAIAIDSGEVEFRLGRLRMLERLGRTNEMLMTWFDIVALPAIPLQQKVAITRDFTKSKEFYRRHLPLLDAIISRLYTLYGTDSEVFTLYAQHKWQTKEPEKVLEAFKRKLTESQPPKVDILREVISMEIALERPDSVYRYGEIGVSHYPDTLMFHSAMLYADHRLKRYDRMVEHCKGLISRPASTRQQQSQWWTEIGLARIEQGLLREGYAAYRKAMSLDRENATARNNYAYNLALEGRSLKQALALAEEAVALQPKNATFLDTLAWVHFKMGNLEEAKRVQQTALSFDTEQSGELALHYGDILAAMGNTFLAHTYWRKALEWGGVEAAEIERRLEQYKR